MVRFLLFGLIAKPLPEQMHQSQQSLVCDWLSFLWVNLPPFLPQRSDSS